MIRKNINPYPLKFRLKLVISLAGFLLLSGCGYHLVGTANKLPSHVRSMAIPVFKNTSGEPVIQRNLSDTVRRTFQNDGRLKIIQEDEADLVMNGTLSHYELRPIAFDENDVVTQYWVYLGIDVEVIDQVKNQPLLKKNFQTRWDYRVGADVIDAESARLEALEQAYLDVGRRLVSIVLDKF